MMNAFYSLRNVEIRQDNGFVLSIDHLELMPGKIYALIGPNGAGKSTLLTTLALLRRPQRGDILLNGCSVLAEKSQLKQYRRQITLVGQFPYLFDRSVYDNLALGLKVRGVSQDAADLRIAEALNSVGLTGFEQRKARQLSVGEVQRVALARALVLQPRVLLLDEPTSNIDAENLQVFEQLVTSLAQQDVTVVFSTHNTLPPRRLGAELICLRDGKVQSSPDGIVAGFEPGDMEKVNE